MLKHRHSAQYRTISEEISLDFEIKDIRDELDLLLRVFEAQRDVIKQLANLFWPEAMEDGKASTYRYQFLNDCGTMNLIDRVNKLDKRAVRTLESVRCRKPASVKCIVLI